MSVIVINPLPLPVVAGVNVTEMTQFAPAARLVTQICSQLTGDSENFYGTVRGMVIDSSKPWHIAGTVTLICRLVLEIVGGEYPHPEPGLITPIVFEKMAVELDA